MAQGGGQEMIHLDIHTALVKNEPEIEGPPIFSRPQPADEGGTNTAGWVKTADYPYLDGDSGIWKQT